MYSYDFVNVLAAAIERAGGVEDREKVLAAMNQVSVLGVNGDQRGFNENNHEGVVDDDVYFARFKGMTYAPGERRSALGDVSPRSTSGAESRDQAPARHDRRGRGSRRRSQGRLSQRRRSCPCPGRRLVLPTTPPLAPATRGRPAARTSVLREAGEP